MEERGQLTQLTNCQNPVCAMEKKVLEDMLQTKRIECQGNCAMELKELKEEMTKLKRDMHDLVSKKQEKEKVIVISPSYSVRSINVDKEGAYRTLVDRTRIMEEQLTDIIRSLEETDKPDHTILAPSEAEKEIQTEEQHQLAKSPRREVGSLSEDQNLPQMQEHEPEGQHGTHEQQHINMEQMKSPCRETEQENEEELQHIEVVEDLQLDTECVELPDTEKSPQRDSQLELALVCVETPNLEESPQQDSYVEQALVCVELPVPLYVPMNLECSLDDQYLRPCDLGLPFDHRESTVEMESAPVEVSEGLEIELQEQANQLSGETEERPYQLGEQVQQSDDLIPGQLMEVETPMQMQLHPRRQRLSKPELPCPGQPEEVRISKMVEKIVLEQQQSSRGLVIGQAARTETPRKRPEPKTHADKKQKPQKGTSTRKASKGKSNSDTASNLSSLEEQQPSEGQSQRKQTKRKLDEQWTPEKDQKQGKQMGRAKKSKLDKKPEKEKQLKCHEPRRLFSDMSLDDEGGASQRSPKQGSNASLMSQDEQQEAFKAPDQAMPVTQEPDSEAAVKIQQEQQCKNKPVKLSASVVTEWLARQGLLEGQKRSVKA